MNTETVLAVAFLGAAAFGAAGIVFALHLVLQRGWTVRGVAGRLSLRH